MLSFCPLPPLPPSPRAPEDIWPAAASSCQTGLLILVWRPAWAELCLHLLSDTKGLGYFLLQPPHHSRPVGNIKFYTKYSKTKHYVCLYRGWVQPGLIFIWFLLICQIGIQTVLGLVRAGNDAGLFLPFCVAMSHSNPLCCTNIKYDFSFFNPNLDQKSYFWGWFNFLALVARLFSKSLFFLTKILGVISGKICGGDNQVFLTLKYFHTNVLVFVKVRLEHSILSDILLLF